MRLLLLAAVLAAPFHAGATTITQQSDNKYLVSEAAHLPQDKTLLLASYHIAPLATLTLDSEKFVAGAQGHDIDPKSLVADTDLSKVTRINFHPVEIKQFTQLHQAVLAPPREAANASIHKVPTPPAFFALAALLLLPLLAWTKGHATSRPIYSRFSN